MFFRYVYIFISKNRIYIFDEYKNWNVRIRRKEGRKRSLFDLLNARYFLRFSKIRIFHRSWENGRIFEKWSAEFRGIITSIKIGQISTREFSFERKAIRQLSQIPQLYPPRFINRFFMNVRYFQFPRTQWLEMMATKSVESKYIFRRDLATMSTQKIFSEMEWLFYRTFSNVTADFPVSRRQFRWHYRQSYGICFHQQIPTRNIFKYS